MTVCQHKADGGLESPDVGEGVQLSHFLRKWWYHWGLTAREQLTIFPLLFLSPECMIHALWLSAKFRLMSMFQRINVCHARKVYINMQCHHWIWGKSTHFSYFSMKL